MNDTNHWRRTLLICIFLGAIILATFWPATEHQFVSYDDTDYVTENAHVLKGLSWANVIWAFRTGHAANWHPLTWLSHMLDVQLFGVKAGAHHLTSLLLHAANAVLLFLGLRCLTGTVWRSTLVAALFALHPLHVESVAWIAERKDVLSGFFFILTLWAYGRYVKCGARNAEREMRPVEANAHNSWRVVRGPAVWYGCALLLFALGLMSKPMLVTLPCVLLLLDYWPLQRFQFATGDLQVPTLKRLMLEKLPFFGLSLASCVATFIAQKSGGAVQTLGTMPLDARLANALVSYARYLGKTFWPVGLAAPYPHPGHWPLATVVLAVALLLLLSLGALLVARKFPFVVAGWLWFVGMLVPVIGVVQVGDQSMADRYTYLPLLGLFVILVWGAGEVFKHWHLPKAAFGIAAGLVLVSYGLRARDQVRYWHDSESLFRHSILVTEKNWLAYYNLGWNLDNQGRFDEAITNYRKAVELEPRFADAWNNLGCLLAAGKHYDEAVTCFETALQHKPDFPSPHSNLARILSDLGRINEAIAHYQIVLQQKPEDPEALRGLGNILARAGQFREAIPYYEAALKAEPEQPQTHYSLANALAKCRQPDQAIEHYRLALQQKPDFADAHNDLGIALARRGQLDEAVLHFREAVRCRPTETAFRCSLGKALAAQQKFEEAIPIYNEALRIAPTNAEAHANLGVALAIRGDVEQAVLHFQETLRYRPGDAVAHFNLGKTLATQHKFNEAISHFTEALRLRPDYAQARQELQALGTQTPE